MKKQFQLFCRLLAPVSIFAININELGSITKTILEQNKLNYIVNLAIDDVQAGGFASITYGTHSNDVFVAVDSRKMQTKSANTWAFIMGHELGHKYIGPGGGAQAEWEADEIGSHWAVNAGYNIKDYIKAMLSDYNSCSPSHGCWHGRAHNLAKLHNIRIYGSDEKDHESHKTGHGAFPPSKDEPIHEHDHEHEHEVPQSKLPETRKIPTRRVAYKVPCQHRVTCQHVLSYGCKTVRKHKWDTKHEYDIIYVEEPIHN